MRKVFLAAAFMGLTAPAMAQGQSQEINVFTPAVVWNAGLQDIAADYTKKTGVKVTIKNLNMGKIVGEIRTGTPIADVIVLPVSFMDGMDAMGATVPGTAQDIGRVTIGLAVKKGAPHPDISTPAKLAAALRAGGPVIYSDPASGSMEARIINDMLRQNAVFKGVKDKISTKGEGGQAVIHGEADMALQLICEIVNHPELELVGPVPVQLHAYLDTRVAVSSRSTQADAAKAFITYMLSSNYDPLWKSKGLDRHPPE
ncbi:MAG TPA: extracellular solute-binding protein [Rhizomicrobium sp.]|nr:extracellular solute-binding protein [Rhizomicrobium sp.]